MGEGGGRRGEGGIEREQGGISIAQCSEYPNEQGSPHSPGVGQRLPLLASTRVYGILFLFFGRSFGSGSTSRFGTGSS